MSQVNEAGDQTTELQVYAELAVACYQLAKLTIERDSLREQNRVLRAAGQAVVEMYRDAPRPRQVDELAAALKMGEEQQ